MKNEELGIRKWLRQFDPHFPIPNSSVLVLHFFVSDRAANNGNAMRNEERGVRN
jgi:hypothetical protein